MRALAIILLVGVFLRHDASIWLAEGSRFSSAAVFFMLGGTLESLLAACLAIVLLSAKPDRWRNLALAALGIAIFEGLQLPICRWFTAPRGINLCDSATGLPVGAWTTAISLAIVAKVAGLLIPIEKAAAFVWARLKNIAARLVRKIKS